MKFRPVRSVVHVSNRPILGFLSRESEHGLMNISQTIKVLSGFHKAYRVEIVFKLELLVSDIDLRCVATCAIMLSACETFHVSQADTVLVQ